MLEAIAVMPKKSNNQKLKNPKLRNKDGQLIIRINKQERDEFLELCEMLDTSAAREIRRFIREFVRENEEEA